MPLRISTELVDHYTGKWMDTNARFKVEKGQMTTQLGQGKAMQIFNENLVGLERVSK